MERFDLLLTDGPRLANCNFILKVEKKQPKKRPEVECEYTLQARVNNKKHEVYVALSVKSETQGIPFSFDMKSEAKFKCTGNCPSEEHAFITTIPYIFSFLKELVADLTRKAYLKPFYLPSIELKVENFVKTSEPSK